MLQTIKLQFGMVRRNSTSYITNIGLRDRTQK